MRRFLVISPLFLLLLGCQHAQTSLYSGGPAAHRIADMQWLLIILFLVITVIMWALIGWAAVTRKGTLAEHAPIDAGGGQGWITIGGLLIPSIILFILFILGLQLLVSFPIHNANKVHVKPDILVIGHQWWWEVHYLNDNPSLQFTTANEIHVPANQPVNIELRTQDVIHSFWVPALHGKVDLIPGHTNFIRIEANQAGDYQGQCAQYCGAQHAHMRLLVVAQPPKAYNAWLDKQRDPGTIPTSKEEIAGEQTFLSGPCSLCHTVRGTIAGGTVGPDLTHIGSRKLIAANSYPNNNAYLEAWITHAQSFKPEAQMPDLTQFTGTQLRDMTAYLRQLQ
jgi:cytochrome c oxidase subunit 2